MQSHDPTRSAIRLAGLILSRHDSQQTEGWRLLTAAADPELSWAVAERLMAYPSSIRFVYWLEEVARAVMGGDEVLAARLVRRFALRLLWEGRRTELERMLASSEHGPLSAVLEAIEAQITGALDSEDWEAASEAFKWHAAHSNSTDWPAYLDVYHVIDDYRPTSGTAILRRQYEEKMEAELDRPIEHTRMAIEAWFWELAEEAQAGIWTASGRAA